MYRPDIDGLRAVAIVPVLLFHLGIPYFTGGYVGVDVFYVISGYLITLLIYREVLTGTFTFGNFYERRMRRLFPALFVVLAITSVFAGVLFLPADVISYSKGLIATSGFAANVLFWKNSGYFARPAEMNPLLHVWSLSVEEQFYIFFPAFLLVCQRFAPRRVVGLLAVVAISSFVASVLLIARFPDAVFYLPVFRAWELFAGALLALGLVPPINSQALRELVAVIALAMILWAVYHFTKNTTFPGMSALLPVLGTAALIHVGGSGGTRLNNLLANRQLVLLGLISYSLYLWHWPLIVLSKYYLIRPLEAADKLLIIAASVALAVLTWRFVEQPFRGRHGIWKRQRLFWASAGALAMLCALGAVGIASGGCRTG